MAKANRVHSTPRRTASKTTKASQADPIFAAIEKHRKMFKAWNALYDALERAETKARKKYGRRPWSLVAWRNYSAIGGSEIEDRREEFLKLPASIRKRSKRNTSRPKLANGPASGPSGHGISAQVSQHSV